MNCAPQPDLNLLDRDELVALVHAHQEELASLIVMSRFGVLKLK